MKFVIVDEVSTYEGLKAWYRTNSGDWTDVKEDAHDFGSADVADFMAVYLTKKDGLRKYTTYTLY